MKNKNVFILLSGGVDSVSLIPYYISKNFDITCLWVDYGQIGGEFEYEAANYFCNKFDLKLVTVNMDENINIVDNDMMEYKGRNLLIISMALSLFPYQFGLISSGIRYSINYPDCQDKFVISISEVVDNISSGKILLDFPFYNFRKNEIIIYAIKNNIDIDKTYSCILGHPKGCEECISCKELNQALKELEIYGRN
jgi:7-cyano-7-deazaguanine synthase